MRTMTFKRSMPRILMHPDTLELVKAAMLANIVTPAYRLPLFGMEGVTLEANPMLPRTRKFWVPPSGPFWSMEASDERWAAPLGFGRYEEAPYYLVIGG